MFHYFFSAVCAPVCRETRYSLFHTPQAADCGRSAQYFYTGSHEAIISDGIFQEVLQRRKLQ